MIERNEPIRFHVKETSQSLICPTKCHRLLAPDRRLLWLRESRRPVRQWRC